MDGVTAGEPRGMRRAWLIVALLAAASALNYFDRNIVAVFKPVLKAEFALNDGHYSWLVTAFMAPYVVAYVLGGRLVDRYGSRWMLTFFLGGWSLATLANGWVAGLGGMLACRFFLGLLEPGGFNAGQRAIMEWFPPEKRGLALSLLAPGTAVGAMLAPPALAVINETWGWRWGFILPGILGLGLAAVWPVMTRPSGSSPVHGYNRPSPGSVPLRRILGCRALWGLLLARVVSDPVWYFYQFWLPGYFQENLGLTLADYGRVGWIPAAVAMVVAVGVGMWTDRQIGRHPGHALRLRRQTLIVLTALAPAAVVTPFAGSTVLALVLVTLIVSLGQAWLFLVSLLQTDLFPREAIGTANGLLGACGAACGLLVNLSLGWLVDVVGYRPLFTAAGIAYLLAAGVVWRLVRAPMSLHSDDGTT